MNSVLGKLIPLLFLALAVRLIFWHGIAPGDPFTYSLCAWDLVQGRWDPAYFFEQSTRWGLLFPLAASYKLWGVNEASSMLWPLVTSLGTVAVAYLLALHLKDERAAVLAGLIVATFPLEIIYASQPMADCPLSFWLLLSLYCFVRGETAATGKRWFFLASGIALALAYATKFVALLVAPFFLLVLLRRRRIEWNWGWLGLGFVLVLMVEFLVFQHLTGNGFARLELVLQDLTSHTPVTSSGFHLPHNIWLYLYWMFVDFHYVGVGFLTGLFLLLRRVAQYWRTGPSVVGQHGLLLLWALTLLVALSLYPTRLQPYTPLYKVEVYMLMFSAPLLVLTAMWLSESTRKAQATALALIVLSSLAFVYLLHASYRAHGDNTRALFVFAQTHPDRPLYAHRSDQRYLQYFAGFQQNERYRSFRLAKPNEKAYPTPTPDFRHSYVAINQHFVAYHQGDEYPPEIHTPPPQWRVIYRHQRPAHWLQRAGISLAQGLQTRGWIAPDTAQALCTRFSRWRPTQPVLVYAAD